MTTERQTETKGRNAMSDALSIDTSSNSRVTVTFPYVPHTEYVDAVKSAPTGGGK
jgi:hypothetical protein